MIERSIVLLKPDTVQRGLMGEVISRFEKVGLKIVGMKMVWIGRDFSKKHYSAHINKGFYKQLEEYIISGPIVAIAVEGVHAVENVRKLIGSTEPLRAAPGTIRGDFSHHSIAYADVKNKSVFNLIHASGTKEEAEAELKLWFKDDELHTYKTVHEEHVF